MTGTRLPGDIGGGTGSGYHQIARGNTVSHFIKDNIRSRRMDYEGPEFDQDNPWGYRHQINMADSGWGSRGPRVQKSAWLVAR